MLAKSSRVGLATDICSPEMPRLGARRGLVLRSPAGHSGLFRKPWAVQTANPAHHSRMRAGGFSPDMAILPTVTNGIRQKNRSGLVPLGQNIFDDGPRRLERGFYIHFARIEQVRAGRRLQRGVWAAHVAIVTALDIGQDGGEIAGPVIGLDLGQPAPRPHFRAGGDIELYRRIGADDRANVAPVQNSPRRLRSKGALLFYQYLPHLGNNGN